MGGARVRVRNLTPVKQEAGPWWIPAKGTATIPPEMVPNFGDAIEVLEIEGGAGVASMYRDICRLDCGHSLCILTQKCCEALGKLGVHVDREPWRRGFDQKPLDGREGTATTPFCNAGTWEGPSGRWSWIHYDNDRAPENHVAYWDGNWEGNICVSESVREGMLRSGAPESKLRLVQNAIDGEIFRPTAPVVEPEGVGDRFLFLMTGALSVRKGTDIALDAFGRTFSDRDPVVLYLRNYDYGRAGETAKFVQEWRKRRGRGAPRVISVYETWSEEQMAGAYRRAAEYGAFLQPHRVEGFGLCGLEALACGCRLGTTGWSGPLEYATEENSSLFGYRMVPSAFNLELYRADENPEWAQPRRKDIQAWMRRVLEESPDRDRQSMIAEEARRKFSFDRMARGVADVLGINVAPEGARRVALPGASPVALPPRSPAVVSQEETLAVAIATRDRLEYMMALLGALLCQTRVPDEIAIVNESDEPYEHVSGAFSWLVRQFQQAGTVVHLLRGTGAGASPNHQRALEAVASDLIMRIDDDLLPTQPDFLEKLYQLINGKAEVGAVAGCYPRVQDKKLHSYARSGHQPGMTNRIADMFRGHVGLQFNRWEDAAIVECEHLYSSYMYRRESLREVGGFAHCYSRFGQREETDASVRLHLLGGLKLLVTTEVVAVHFEAEGGRRPEMNQQNWVHDERVFTERYAEWQAQAAEARA